MPKGVDFECSLFLSLESQGLYDLFLWAAVPWWYLVFPTSVCVEVFSPSASVNSTQLLGNSLNCLQKSLRLYYLPWTLSSQHLQHFCSMTLGFNFLLMAIANVLKIRNHAEERILGEGLVLWLTSFVIPYLTYSKDLLNAYYMPGLFWERSVPGSLHTNGGSRQLKGQKGTDVWGNVLEQEETASA